MGFCGLFANPGFCVLISVAGEASADQDDNAAKPVGGRFEDGRTPGQLCFVASRLFTKTVCMCLISTDGLRREQAVGRSTGGPIGQRADESVPGDVSSTRLVVNSVRANGSGVGSSQNGRVDIVRVCKVKPSSVCRFLVVSRPEVR